MSYVTDTGLIFKEVTVMGPSVGIVGIVGIVGSSSAANTRKRKSPASEDEEPNVGIQFRKTDGGSFKVTIPETTIAKCTKCSEHVLFTELDQHPCKEYSGGGTASLQGKKIAITDPEKKYKAHQLTALAWILRPYSDEWKKLAEEFDLSKSDREEIKTKHSDNNFRMLAVLNAVSEQFQQYGVDQMNKGQLISALQKINVYTPTLEKINNAKLEEEHSASRLATMQIGCPDELKIQISNPDKPFMWEKLLRMDGVMNKYRSNWRELAMLFCYPLSSIEKMAGFFGMIGLLNIIRTNNPSDRINKHLVITALQSVGVVPEDLSELDKLL